MPDIMPKFLAIVNVTDDSFSDGGKFISPDAAINQAQHLHDSGADVIDLGAASSNVNSSPVPPETEISRLATVIPTLKANNITISVDTFNPEVQHWCLDNDVDYINDIQGFPYPDVYEHLASSSAQLFLMHSVQRLGFATEITTDPVKVFTSMLTFFGERINALSHAGVSTDRIILDPGMGNFLGSNPETSTYVMQHIPQLKSEFNLPVMIAASRKSFLARISDCDADTSIPLSTRRSAATIAAEITAAEAGADWIRTHNVAAIRSALQVRNVIR